MDVKLKKGKIDKPKFRESYVDENSTEHSFFIDSMLKDFDTASLDFVKGFEIPVDKDKDTYENRVKFMNEKFHKQMMMQCLLPLLGGINKDSIISSAVMYFTYRQVSKDFGRDMNFDLNNLFGKFKSVFTANDITNVNRKIDKIDKKIEKQGDSDKDLTKLYEKKQVYKDKVEELRDKYYYQFYGTKRLSPKSCSVLQLKNIVTAYEKMRTPDEEGNLLKIEDVAKEFNEVRDKIYNMAKSQGIDKGVIDLGTNRLVGHLIQKDAKYSAYFNETAYGEVKRSGYEFKEYEENGKRMSGYVWEGKFSNPDGSDYLNSFTPRAPLPKELHFSSCNNFIRDRFFGYKNMNEVKNSFDDKRVVDDFETKFYMFEQDGFNKQDLVQNCVKNQENYLGKFSKTDIIREKDVVKSDIKNYAGLDFNGSFTGVRKSSDDFEEQSKQQEDAGFEL